MTIGAGWESWKLAHAYHRIGSGTTPASGNAEYYDDENGTPWITTSELRETYIKRTSSNVTQSALDDFTTLRTYAPNSVFMAMYGATIGRLGISTMPATCNQACCVFEASGKFTNRFLFYWLWHRRAELISLSVGGGQPNLSQQDLKSEIALCPPLETQQRIAAFLDEKTAQIDGLIARKQTLLERLAEKRQAIITQAVTKGLNPTAPLKDSGIEWLGEMPAHWEKGNIRRFAMMKTGHTPSRSVPEYWDDCTIPWFTLSDVWQLRDGTRVYIENTAEKISALGLSNSAAELLPAGTVIFSRTASIGFSGIMPVPMATTQDFWNWICGPKLTPEFLLFMFRAMTQKFAEITNGSTHKTIYQPIAAGLEICVPPGNEQKAICAYIKEGIQKIDAARSSVSLSAGRLKEYRSALITSAVTGQIEGLR